MIDKRHKEALIKIVGKGARFHCSMAQYTTFRIGGEADALCFVERLSELQQTVSYLVRENIPFFIVGKGSNLLIRNGGFEGILIIMRGELATIETDEENTPEVTAGGGLGLNALVTYCSQKGLGGLEFLVGIPGTVGGAVAMNAGAFGEEVEGVVESIQVLTPQGKLETKYRSELAFSYRNLSLPEKSIVVRASFRCVQKSREMVSRKVSDYLKRRKATQPLEYPSAGSIFRNPKNDSAGRLIEKAGLKGKKVGGAMISPKHANYIVNTGEAKAEDVLTLMGLARQKVKEDTGIVLETEIRIIGGKRESA
ncbi:MAG: UDP-N-acetylmuramate dehydrogenase [Deltaproteobacteria bacterium]|nr:UDP-N-acetylmuramate dehydrogenase [Deltaproteobacteria bacterium]